VENTPDVVLLQALMGPNFELLSRGRVVNRSSDASEVNLVPDAQVVDSNVTALLVNTNVIWRLLLVDIMMMLVHFGCQITS